MSQFKGPPFQPSEPPQQWYPPPQQYYPQPPTKRRTRLPPWLMIVLAFIAVAVVVLLVYQFGFSSTNTVYNIGQTASIGYWQATVNNAYTHYGAPSGDTYLVFDVTVANASSSSQILSSLTYFNLTDSTGQTYREQFTAFGQTVDGTILPGASLNGQLVYDVPLSQHTYMLHVLGGNGSSATWTVDICKLDVTLGC